MYCTANYRSPVGTLTLACDESGGHLTGLWIEGQKYHGGSLAGDLTEDGALPIFALAGSWLNRYFAGEKPAIAELPLQPAGSAFRQAVWALLCAIPYGETTTYGAIARQLAAQAGRQTISGQACGRRGRAQPHLHHHPLPPRGGRGRQPHRVCRGRSNQAIFACTRRRRSFTSICSGEGHRFVILLKNMLRLPWKYGMLQQKFMTQRCVAPWTGYKGCDVPAEQRPERFLKSIWPLMRTGIFFGGVAEVRQKRGEKKPQSLSLQGAAGF